MVAAVVGVVRGPGLGVAAAIVCRAFGGDAVGRKCERLRARAVVGVGEGRRHDGRVACSVRVVV